MRRLIEYIVRNEDNYEPLEGGSGLRWGALERLFYLRRQEWYRWHA